MMFSILCKLLAFSVLSYIFYGFFLRGDIRKLIKRIKYRKRIDKTVVLVLWILSFSFLYMVVLYIVFKII